MLFFIASLGVRAEDKSAVNFIFSVQLSPENLKTDPPTVETKNLYRPARVMIETIPPVFKTEPSGNTVMVTPEIKLAHNVHAVYEMHTYKLIVAGDLMAKLKELAAKSAKVDVQGIKTNDEIKVTSIDEKK